MTKKEKLVWRLGKLPTPDEVRELVKDKIITQEEAREILFSSESIEERDENSLKNEIKFLRELVDKLTAKLSHGRNTITEIIREVEKPYARWQWYQPYQVWCSNDSIAAGTITYLGANGSINTSDINASNNVSFSMIKTF